MIFIEFVHKGQTYVFCNAMEEIVFGNVRSMISRDSEMCKCEKCFYDVCAVVLNNTGTKYGTSQMGALMSKVASSSMQSVGVLSVEIIKAINLVKAKPNH